ncbi:phosphotriesterase-related protein [Streptomyces tubbatahanensis]|uniref:Phosphotriesterase-related protein n=1 Tax=Streptomyces tubbatahanensis TaxID=2923272 RepID=A0ABY3XQR8_9ACTN|nr:phosphotriesterase-related protein [Streptomyces tubbatahanensis]UNS96699.1 phosphotriesterase-related protein [Streptomyces tubbatahanensis]
MTTPASTAPQPPYGPVVQTVSGPVPADRLGLVLPHEHLFNDLSGVRNPPSYGFTEKLPERPVSASVAWALRHDPYCNRDNVAPKPLADVVREIDAFRDCGGGTLVDVTCSAAIGRNPELLRQAAERGGVHVVMGCGAYLERFEGGRIAAAAEEQAARIVAELDHGVGPHAVRPGIIGEIGVSPAFTEAERASVRAAALAQLDRPHVPLMLHLPGWQRRAHEVLDLVLDEVGVAPGRVVLAHMDPSGHDAAYQESVAARGVWLEFDMIGMEVAFPGEGAAPSAPQTAEAVARLVRRGHAGQLLLSHDLFLKQMWTQHGGNGFTFVPTVFGEMLAGRGLDRALITRLTHGNPARMLAPGAAG